MTDRATRLRDRFLSPGISIVFGIVAAVNMLPGNWLAVLLSVLIGVLMVYDIKARALFKGESYPFVAIFLFLQLATHATWQGSVIALFVAVALSVLYLLFQRADETKTIFLIYCLCGVGALWQKSFLYIGCALYLVIILMRAFSLRVLVASFLGLLTPLIILGGFGLLDVYTLIENYMQIPVAGVAPQWIFSAAIAVLFGIVMFLPSYGYPAKQRARNMAMLGLTALAVALPVLDFMYMDRYIPLLNMCGAYGVAHFSATHRYGWIAALLVIVASVLFVFMV